jgi:hypothetical protein
MRESKALRSLQLTSDLTKEIDRESTLGKSVSIRTKLRLEDK